MAIAERFLTKLRYPASHPAGGGRFAPVADPTASETPSGKSGTPESLPTLSARAESLKSALDSFIDAGRPASFAPLIQRLLSLRSDERQALGLYYEVPNSDDINKLVPEIMQRWGLAARAISLGERPPKLSPRATGIAMAARGTGILTDGWTPPVSWVLVADPVDGERRLRELFPHIRFDIAPLPPPTVNLIADALVSLAYRFPKSTGDLRYVGVFSPSPDIPPARYFASNEVCMTDRSGRVIGLNPSFWSNPTSLYVMLAQTASTKWNSPGSEKLVSPFIQEFGHVVASRLNREVKGFRSWVSLAYRLDASEGQLSRYAARNEEEAFAQGFCTRWLTLPNTWGPYVRNLDSFLTKQAGVL